MNHILFAQETSSQSGGLIQTLVMIGVALVFFYFILWRPQQKQRKVAEDMRSALKVGDRVTAMAIIGKISKINKDTVILTMVDGAKIEMLKYAITDVNPTEATVEV